MRITYLDNSGFFLAMRDASLVFDCWRFPAPGEAAGFSNGYLDRAVLTGRPRAYFFVSHVHADHFHPEIFRFADAAAETMFLLDKDIPVPEGVPHHFLSPGEEFSDGYVRVRAFGSTDLGVSFLAEAEGRRIFHAGDLNFWHWREESTEAEVREAREAFLAELERMAPAMAGGLDAAFFPVDPRMGSEIEAGAAEFARRFAPRLLIPMHFGENFAAMQAACRTGLAGQRIWAPTRRGDTVLLE